MRLLPVALLAALWVVPGTVRAKRPRLGEPGSVGLGISLGDPTGVSAKFFLHPHHALQSSAGFGPVHLGAGRVDLTYLYHSKPWGAGNLQPHGYVGIGVGVAFWEGRIGHLGPFGPDPEDFRQAAAFFRAPVLGMTFHYQSIPVDIFFEGAYSPLIGPPITYWNFDFALGARYWF